MKTTRNKGTVESVRPSTKKRTRESDPRSFVLKGTKARLPVACACCLEPATHEVAVSKVQKESAGVATISETRAMTFPFCETCAEHMAWAKLGGGPAALAIGLVVAVAVAFLVGTGFSIAFGGLMHSSYHATRDQAAVLFSMLVGAGPGFLVARHLLARKPRHEVPDHHTCKAGRSVEIVKFSETYTQLAFADPTFGRVFAKMND